MTKTLADFFGVEEIEFDKVDYQEFISTTAHVTIDVQREFCDPEYTDGPIYNFGRNYVDIRGTDETEEVAENIANSIIPKFREAGLKQIHVYYSKNPEDDNADVIKGGGGFYKIKPNPEEQCIRKITNSAFESGDFYSEIKKAGIKRLIISGFNASVCVSSTAMDALSKKFEVCVLQDGVCNDLLALMKVEAEETLKTLSDNGVVLSDTKEVCDKLKEVKQKFKLSR